MKVIDKNASPVNRGKPVKKTKASNVNVNVNVNAKQRATRNVLKHWKRSNHRRTEERKKKRKKKRNLVDGYRKRTVRKHNRFPPDFALSAPI